MIDTLTRAGIAIFIIFGGLGLSLLYQYWTRFRARSRLTDLGPLRPGASALVYFTTPTCVPCKTVQRPAIQKVSQILGDALQVFEIDATQRPGIASRWGILSVPTTFVVDPRGEVVHVNYGVARAEKLLMQIQHAKG